MQTKMHFSAGKTRSVFSEQIRIDKKLHMSAVISASFLFVFGGLAVFPVANRPDDTQAANTISETTLAMTTADIALEFDVNNPNGTFSASDPTDFTVATNNYSGYTLSISAKENDADNSKLINDSYAFNSISSASSQNDFTNGTWGYKPSKINSTANTDFLPAPSYAGDTLDVTAAANNEANTYSIALGAKADYTLPAGEYKNTFVITAIANPVGYQISYSENTEDTVTNMPSAQSGDVTATEVTIASEIPVRSGYTFNNWCPGTVTTTNGVDSCDVTTFQPGEVLTLSQTTTNVYALKAMWNSNLPAVGTFERAFYDANKTTITISGVDYYYMQDMTANLCENVAVGQETHLVDSRDNAIYAVGKLADGRCWLLDNLALDLTDSSVQTNLTNDTTNASSVALNYLKNGGGSVSDQWATAGVSNWTSSWSLSSPLQNADSVNVVPQGDGDPQKEQALEGDWKTGIYYNYCAASAGTHCWGNSVPSDSDTGNLYDIVGDICPSGWRMPTGGSTGEYQALYDAYPGASGTGEGSSYAIFRNALHLPLSGGFWDGNVANVGINGWYLSSTNNGHVDVLNVDGYAIDSSSMGMSFDNGVPVRCIARSSTDSDTFEGAFVAKNKPTITVGNKEYYRMQDMDSDICSNVQVEQKIQLVDVRDNKIYWVAKLADGKCWMTQNLDLDLESTATNVAILTSENTDLNVYGSNGYDSNNGYSQMNGVISWTPENSTVSNIDSSGNIADFSNDNNNPYSVDPGNWYWTDTWYASTQNNYLKDNGAGDKFSQDPYSGNGEHGHVGNYYNWSAAVASNDTSSYTTNTSLDISNNPQNSICPAGWRLPTIYVGADTDPKNEFRYLLDKYGAYATSGSERDKALTVSPLWFVRGGLINSDKLNYSGWYGSYWSSTVEVAPDGIYRSYFSSGGVYPSGVYDNYSGTGHRYEGQSVRCVARTGGEELDTFGHAYATANKTTITVGNNQYYKMQDMDSNICSAVRVGQETRLVDIRDYSIYTVGKLEDNRCWLLDNLALDLVGTSLADLKGYTNATDAQLTYLKNGGGSTSDQWATNGVKNWYNSNSVSAPLQQILNRNVLPVTKYNGANEPMKDQVMAGQWKTGAYYNFCAASAGTYCWSSGVTSDPDSSSLYDIAGDICPSGWRIPTSTADGEYNALYEKYPTIVDGDTQYTRFREALHIPLSGNFNNNSVGQKGEWGNFWSSTYSINYMYYLRAEESLIDPQKTSYRGYGFSVRCIAK